MSEFREARQSRELLGFVALLISVLLGLALYMPAGKAGALGNVVQKVCLGLWGPMGYILPVIPLFSGLVMLLGREYRTPRNRILHMVLLLVIGAGLWQIAHFSVDDTRRYLELLRSSHSTLQDGTKLPASMSLEFFWQASINPAHYPIPELARPGGFIGGIFATGLEIVLGFYGALSVLILMLLVEFFILGNFSISLFLEKRKEQRRMRREAGPSNLEQMLDYSLMRSLENHNKDERSLSLLSNESDDEEAGEPETEPQDLSDHPDDAIALTVAEWNARYREAWLQADADEVGSDILPVMTTPSGTESDIQAEAVSDDSDSHDAQKPLRKVDPSPWFESFFQEAEGVSVRSAAPPEGTEDADTSESDGGQADDDDAPASDPSLAGIEIETYDDVRHEGSDATREHGVDASSEADAEDPYDAPILLHSSKDFETQRPPIRHIAIPNARVREASLTEEMTDTEPSVEAEAPATEAAAPIAVETHEEPEIPVITSEDVREDAGNDGEGSGEVEEPGLSPTDDSPEDEDFSRDTGTPDDTEIPGDSETDDEADSSSFEDESSTEARDEETAETSEPEDSDEDEMDWEPDLDEALSDLVIGREPERKRPYVLPPLSLLNEVRHKPNDGMRERVQNLARRLVETLASFGVEARVEHITTGPTITRFEVAPGPGVKVSRIVNLADDIALSLAAVGVRIEAPIPGKSAIGIEIPNDETRVVDLRSLLESQAWRAKRDALVIPLGRDIAGAPIICDLKRMPHLLIAGATGSGKSICINTILMSVLYNSSPDEVRLLMIDPKVVELSVYNGIPHLLAPVVTDPKKASNTLNWAVSEMERRYALFAQFGVRDMASYNQFILDRREAVRQARDQEDIQALLRYQDEDERRRRQAEARNMKPRESELFPAEETLPNILLVIDELSDLMQTSPKEVEDAIARLTAMARAAGIHLVIATQRPSVDVITGVIKANIPSRIAFAVSSQIDSRTILDQAGAEKLLGKGDMLYAPQDKNKPVRGQGAFVSSEEVERVVSFIREQDLETTDPEIAQQIVATGSGSVDLSDDEDRDELYNEAVDVLLDVGYASVSILQRRLNVGYPRAARLIDTLEQDGLVGPFEGSKPRDILIDQATWEAMKRGESEN